MLWVARLFPKGLPHWASSKTWCVGKVLWMPLPFASKSHHLHSTTNQYMQIRSCDIQTGQVPFISLFRCWTSPGLPSVTNTVHNFLWTEFLGAIKGWRVSGLVVSWPHLWFLQMMWFCWHHRAMISSLHWGGMHKSVMHLELALPSLRLWFSVGKRWRWSTHSG